MNQNQQTCIILFAKFPTQGMAKTRLQPALGIEDAAQMAHKLLFHNATLNLNEALILLA